MCRMSNRLARPEMEVLGREGKGPDSNWWVHRLAGRDATGSGFDPRDSTWATYWRRSDCRRRRRTMRRGSLAGRMKAFSLVESELQWRKVFDRPRFQKLGWNRRYLGEVRGVRRLVRDQQRIPNGGHALKAVLGRTARARSTTWSSVREYSRRRPRKRLYRIPEHAARRLDGGAPVMQRYRTAPSA